jgi:hypothetical protein
MITKINYLTLEDLKIQHLAQRRLVFEKELKLKIDKARKAYFSYPSYQNLEKWQRLKKML